MSMEYADSSSNAVNKPADSTVGWMESVIEAVSQTSLGQTLLKFADRFLWVVEKSAQWSLPYQEVAAEENGKTFGTMKLVRPLPWVLFLSGLVVLRVIRAGLNVGAFVLGYPQIQPSGVVKFVQRSRRRLRAVKMSGMKNLRRKTCGTKSSPSPPPTRIHITGPDLEVTPTQEEKSTTESADSPTHVETKRKFSEVSSDDQDTQESEEESLLSEINRLALDDSLDDPDFNPADCTTSESSTASSENSEVEFEVSMGEVVDVKNDALKPLPNDIKKKVPPTKSYVQNVQKDEDTFFSPISSGSASPERCASPVSKVPVAEKVPK